jgi:hypothetical protein
MVSGASASSATVISGRPQEELDGHQAGSLSEGRRVPARGGSGRGRRGCSRENSAEDQRVLEEDTDTKEKVLVWPVRFRWFYVYHNCSCSAINKSCFVIILSICHSSFTCRIEVGGGQMESMGSAYFRSAKDVKTPPPSPSLSLSSSSLDPSSSPSPSLSSQAQDLDKNERYQELKEQLHRTEGEVRTQIRELLRFIGVRDQVLTASRRAHQLLNRQCKSAISSILRKLVDREREGEC